MIKNLKITTLLIAIVAVFSCDHIIKNNQAKTATKKNILQDKEVAKLLLEVSQKNLNVIALCNQIQDFDQQLKKDSLAESIKLAQIYILNKVEKVASKNLILIANAPKIKVLPNQLKGTEVYQKTVIKKIKKNLDYQQNAFEVLANKSDKELVKKIAFESSEKIENILNNTVIALER